MMETEKRLIDAIELRAALDTEDPQWFNNTPYYPNWLINTYIASCPTVDAVEVVRCKVCCWFDECNRCTNPKCAKSFYGCPVPEEHYCSYGEKEE